MDQEFKIGDTVELPMLPSKRKWWEFLKLTVERVNKIFLVTSVTFASVLIKPQNDTQKAHQQWRDYDRISNGFE